MPPVPSQTPSPSDPTALDRLVAVFGSQKALCEIAGRGQSTVSGWADRGVPAELARVFRDAARARGLTLSLDEVYDWIDGDAWRRGAAKKGAAARKSRAA